VNVVKVWYYLVMKKIILISVILAVFVITAIVVRNIFFKQISYQCPNTEWYNCMPGSSDSKYCGWISENCPFQQIAY